MWYAAAAWFFFFAQLALLCAVDYQLRARGSWLSDYILFGVPAIMALLAVPLLWRSTSGSRRRWMRAVIVSIHLLLGFALYCAVGLWYVVEAGIDSM